MSRLASIVPAALLLPLLLTACATQQPPAPKATLSENEAQAAFLRGCTRKGPQSGAAMERHRVACECSWRVVRRHMSIEEIAHMGIRAKETGQRPDSPKFRAAVADMQQECRTR